MKKLLFITAILLLAGCSRTPEELFQSFWGDTHPPSLRIHKVLRSTSPYTAVFVHVSKTDFLSFQQSSSEFATWYPVSSGMVIEIGKIELHAPSDIRGIYSVGNGKDGYSRVIVWDEKSETIIMMWSSGLM